MSRKFDARTNDNFDSRPIDIDSSKFKRRGAVSVSAIADLYQVVNKSDRADDSLVQNKYTLAFNDSHHEHNFVTSQNDVSRLLFVTIAAPVVEVIWLILSLASPEEWDSTTGSALSRIPFIFLSICLHITIRKRVPFFTYHYQATATVFSIAMMLSVLITLLFDSFHSSNPILVSPQSLLMYMLIMGVYGVFLGLLFVRTLVISVVLLILAFSLSSLESTTDESAVLVVIVLMSLAVNLSASYTNELYRRRRFSSAFLLGDIHCKVGRLLSDLLPPLICEQVLRNKNSDQIITYQLPLITVMFVSINHFSDIVEKLGSDQLFDKLNRLLARFDEMVQQSKLYKIEYIEGDYVVSSCLVRDLNLEADLDETRQAEAEAMIKLAFQMMEIGKSFDFDMKAGLNSGPSVAGIIGHSRKFYRLFGDTVNTASRMKTYGEPGRVHISSSTFSLVGDLNEANWLFSERTLEVKGKGSMRTYLVDQIVKRGSNTKADKILGNGGMRNKVVELNQFDLHSPSVSAAVGMELASPLMSKSAEANQQISQLGLQLALKAGLRSFSCKFRNPALENAFSSTRTVTRNQNMILNGFLSVASINLICIALAVFQHNNHLYYLIPMGIACGIFIGSVTYAAVRYSPTNKQIKKYILQITFAFFFTLMIALVLDPGAYIYPAYQLWVGLTITTGAGVGLGMWMLISTFIVFHLVAAYSLDNLESLAFSVRILLLMLIVVKYCSFNQKRSRVMWYLDLSMNHETRQARDMLSFMLPNFVIEEISKSGSSAPKNCECLVVLFSDISGFTKLSSQLTAMQLVGIMHEIYRSFDVLVQSYGLYKMDTIGDAYVVIGGLSGVSENNVRNVVLRMMEVARNMIDILAAYRQKSGYDIQMRVGIHRGPAVAGVVGVTNKRFHVFGKTIENANKLESDGIKSHIHVSSIIARDIFPFFRIRHRYDESAAGTIQSEHELTEYATFIIVDKIDRSRVHNVRMANVDAFLQSSSTVIDDMKANDSEMGTKSSDRKTNQKNVNVELTTEELEKLFQSSFETKDTDDDDDENNEESKKHTLEDCNFCGFNVGRLIDQCFGVDDEGEHAIDESDPPAFNDEPRPSAVSVPSSPSNSMNNSSPSKFTVPRIGSRSPSTTDFKLSSATPPVTDPDNSRDEGKSSAYVHPFKANNGYIPSEIGRKMFYFPQGPVSVNNDNRVTIYADDATL